jgi:TRAP-type C4-dicarboxylate transport system permease small subunit
VSANEPTARRGYARRALDLVDAIIALLVILAMAGMIIIVAVQVGLRYVLNQSFDWADELSRLLFVWSVFLAIPLGIKRGSHISVELLTGWLPEDVHQRLFRMVSMLAMALMTVVAWQAAILTRDQWDEPMSTLDISVGVFMLPLLIGAVHSLLHLLVAVIDGRPVRTLSETE